MKTAAQIVEMALTLVDEQVTDILDASDLEMSLTDVALSRLPEVARSLIKDLPFELKKYISEPGTLILDPLADGEIQTSYTKRKVAFIPPSDFWELVAIRLKAWSRPVNNYILVDSPEYSIQNNPFTRGGKQNPVAAVSSTNSPVTIYQPNKTPVYGRMYNGYAIHNSSPIHTINAHIPTDAEWTTLITYIGGVSGSATKLKATGNVYWNAENIGTDAYGFGLRGGGFRNIDVVGNGSEEIGVSTKVWSTLIDGESYGGIKVLQNSADVALTQSYAKNIGAYVRLIIDTPEEIDGTSAIYTGNDGNRYDCVLIGTQWWLASGLVETLYQDGTEIPIVTDSDSWDLLTTGAMCSYNNVDTNAFVETEETVSRTVDSAFRIECFSVGATDTTDVSLFEYISFDNYPRDTIGDVVMWPDELFEKITKALAAELFAIKGRITEGAVWGEETQKTLEQHK